jgi:fermentation-respiration switch protein FrsA (DUF1100 family)
MTAALMVAAGIVALYAVIAFLLWRFQERIVFQPPIISSAPSADDTRRLAYVAEDGVELFAHVVGSVGAGGPVVLGFHGNAVVARWLLPWAREVARRFDATVILPEYRGYDGLRGAPTYASVALDARAAMRAAVDLAGVPASDIVVFGHSLGSALAAELAKETAVRRLVLQAPFTSARDMAARWPVVGLRTGWSLVSRVHYDTPARIRDLDIPVDVAHGERDMTVPSRMGREVFAAARRRGELLMIPGAGHNDVPEVGGEEYWRWLERAMRR